MFFFKRFSLMWTVFKVFIEFFTILLRFHVLVFWPQSTWDLGFPTRFEPTALALEGGVFTAGLPESPEMSIRNDRRRRADGPP